MGDEIIVLITASSPDEAAKIGSALVEEHLAACANIVPEIRSLFYWAGKVQDESEVLMLVKSRLPLMEKLVARVTSLHSYSVPEIIAIPVVAGSKAYLEWLAETTKD